jgi:hypothetical protein
LLYEIIFEREGFFFVVYYDVVDVGDFADERAGFGVLPAGFQEIGTDAAAEIESFADVNDGAGGVAEEIDAGLGGKGGGFLAEIHENRRGRALQLIARGDTTSMIANAIEVYRVGARL